MQPPCGSRPGSARTILLALGGMFKSNLATIETRNAGWASAGRTVCSRRYAVDPTKLMRVFLLKSWAANSSFTRQVVLEAGAIRAERRGEVILRTT